MSDFAKEIHNMFDHIWDCEIDHPVYQDTVGELMEAVIQAYEKHNLTLSTNLAEVGTDCISREQAIDALGELATFTEDWSSHTWMYTDDVYNAIKQLPTIQPKRGRWIPVDAFTAFGGDEATWMAHGNPTAFHYCSVCKGQAYAGEDGESLLTDFCPNCGADMRGEQNG